MAAAPDTGTIEPEHVGFHVEDDQDEIDLVDTSSDDTSDSYESGSEFSVTADESHTLEQSEIEALFYYAGIRENRHGPKLIYRDSSDAYEELTGPEQYIRLMRLIPVPDNHELGQDGQWVIVRDGVVVILDEDNVKFTCVDLVRFTWLNEWEDEEIKQVSPEGEYGDRHKTNATIWIGVQPDAITAATACEVTKRIRTFLNGISITNVDIAFRETVPEFLAGPGLFAPAGYVDSPRKPIDYVSILCDEFIDPVSVALSLPIAGRNTTMQGTMGPYFHAQGKLYAIATRHQLFTDVAGNNEFRYHQGAPEMSVVLMSDAAFATYLALVREHISTLTYTVRDIENHIEELTFKIQNGTALPQSQTILANKVARRNELLRKMDVITAFLTDIETRLGDINQRIIGHVVWAPPISVGSDPCRYTRDFCVVELDKEKFGNFLGNVLSLGPQSIDNRGRLEELLQECDGDESEFTFPDDSLLSLGNILTAEEITQPDTKNFPSDRMRRAFKRGSATDPKRAAAANVTVGTISRFMSVVRKYHPTGHLESVELPILPHENEAGTFSKAGDSGSIIVSPKGEFIALLTSGTNQGIGGSDITYSTIFEWVWDQVCEEFPGADLNWDDIVAFLAA